MTENEINITDMIKALQCVASQDADGDCYCDHFNAHLTCEQFGDNARLDEKHMSCGGILKDTQSCPYSQKTYGVCYEDGELWWLKDIVSILEEIQEYRAIGTVEEFKAYKQGNCTNDCEHYDSTAEYVRNNAIDEFAHQFKENLNQEFPRNYESTRPYFSLENARLLVDEIAEQMKAGGIDG